MGTEQISLAIYIGCMVSIAIAVSIYLFLYHKHKKAFVAKNSALESMLSVFSHIEDASSKPALHVVAGVLLTIPLCAGLVLMLFGFLNPDYTFPEFLAAFSAVTVVFFASLEIWTLWQARRIAWRQGYVIPDFYRLIEELCEELERLIVSIQTVNKGIPKGHHRVHIVAPHFFYGMLSYPETEIERRFRNALVNICEIRAAAAAPFPLEIICLTETGITDWHKRFYSKRRKGQAADIRAADEKFKNLVKEMKSKAYRQGDAGSIFTRVEEMPRVHFFVIGNKLFELTMLSEKNSTEISSTQVFVDSRQADAYVEQADFMKALIDNQKP